MTACLSHCREAPALLLQLCSDAKEDTQLCKIRQRGCPMSVWGRGSGCQVAGSQRGTARRGLCSSAAPAADPVPPNRIYFTIFHPRTSLIRVLLLVVKACVWREVEVVGVGDVASLFPARAFVWGDVDPHGSGLGAGEPDGGAVVVEIHAPALLVCLG